jgi:hypothetical protein
MACEIPRSHYLDAFFPVVRFIMKSLLCGFLTASLLTSGAFAQFHSRTTTGHTPYNKQAMDSAQAHFEANRPAGMENAGAARSGDVTGTPNTALSEAQQVRFNGASNIYISDAQKAAFSRYDLRIGEQKDLNIDVWGRSIYHSDGSYTESQEHNEGQGFLQQTTYSKNGVEIQRRSITLDQRGMPDEVLIYAGGENGKLKYRGKHHYDQLGRFSEEHLFSSDGTLIRRKVQEYTAEGKRLPLRSWDYVENVPSDLRLLITRESEDPDMQPKTPAQPQQPERAGLFNRNKSNQQNSANMAVGSTASTQQDQRGSEGEQETVAPKQTIGSRLGRLFGNRK